MKILHLFSDWKWTGPAEPTLDMVQGLTQAGVDVRLAVSQLPFDAEDTVHKHAALRSVDLLNGYRLRKHYHFLHNALDTRKLQKYIAQESIDIVHCHRHQDHFVGASLTKKLPIRLVRSSHEGKPLKRTWRNRRNLKRTQLYLPVSHEAARADEKLFGIPPEKIHVLEPCLDTSQFDPSRPFKSLHDELKIPRGKILIGIVARMQTHRRFEDLLLSWKLVAEAREDVHFVIIGRGTNMQKVAVEPVNQLGLQERVTFAGYHRETYIDMLQHLNIKMFLVPGSDGSCRALRQALSLGIPAVVSDRGMLPELVIDGSTGFVTDGTATALAEAQVKLLDEERRRRMGEAARQWALEHSLESQSQKLIELYTSLLA